MSVDLQSEVAEIRANQRKIAFAQYCSEIRNIDDDDFFVEQQAHISNHLMDTLERNYDSAILAIKNGDATELHCLEAKWLFDLYYGYESDISISFLMDFTLAQHTIAMAYRERLAIVDYILRRKELCRCVMNLSVIDAETSEGFKSVRDSLELLRAGSDIMVPLFQNVIDSLTELKSFIIRMYNLHLAMKTELADTLESYSFILKESETVEK